MNIGHFIQALFQHLSGQQQPQQDLFQGTHTAQMLQGQGVNPHSTNNPAVQAQQQRIVSAPPDITVDPSGKTPFSARTPQLAKLGNRYVANPTSPQFLGVDPMLFGFPADNTARPPMGQWNPSMGGAPLPRVQEDSAQVWGPRGPGPLSSINMGEPWNNMNPASMYHNLFGKR